MPARRLVIPIGERFGRLVAVAERDGDSIRVRCDCGTEKNIKIHYLKTTQSCGCLVSEVMSARQTTHGHTGTRVYKAWDSMIARCTNPRHRRWSDYGGRGITVCARWRTFENFLADMGEPPVGHSLDRIDNNRGYEPSNCRWATAKQQANNRRMPTRRAEA